MFVFINLRKLSIIACSLAISACGGDDNNNTHINPTPLQVKDIFTTVTPNKESFIDFASFVQGEQITLLSIEPDEHDERCGKPIINGMRVSVEMTGGSFCQFTYTATRPGEPQATAALRVFATNAANPILPPISEAIVLEGDTFNGVSFNIETLLGSDWKSTYALNASMQVKGVDDNLGFASLETSTPNTIKFIPPSVSGWNRIIYTLDDSSASDETVVGEVYVTISSAANQAPIINFPKYDYNFVPATYSSIFRPSMIGCNGNQGWHCWSQEAIKARLFDRADSGNDIQFINANNNYLGEVHLPLNDPTLDGRTFSIEVWSNSPTLIRYAQNKSHSIRRYHEARRTYKNFNGEWYPQNLPDPFYVSATATLNLNTLAALEITEPDGQDWKVVYVQSFSATVSIGAAHGTISFTPNETGEHIVNYVVADNYGGYSSGLIKIRAVPNGDIPTWSNIETGNNTYTGPHTYKEATDKGFLVAGYWDAAANKTVAGYNENTAKSYCSTVGSLPTVEEIRLLRDGPASELSSWPKLHPYLALDGQDMKSINLTSGVEADYNAAKHYYVTCVL